MIVALSVLLISVVIGIVAHELSHAIALWAFDVPCRLRVLPDRDGGGSLRIGLGDRLAAVSFSEASASVAPWKLRVAALMPLVLALPVALVALGIVPTGGIDDGYITASLIGVTACAIPSPADFAVVWYPGNALEDR